MLFSSIPRWISLVPRQAVRREIPVQQDMSDGRRQIPQITTRADRVAALVEAVVMLASTSWQALPVALDSRVHIDRYAHDREAEVERLIDLGATRLWDVKNEDFEWTTLADLEGNEFCVVQSENT
jgi:Glyoxalase-like domain